MKVLVTGFGPFPGVPHNVSADLAARCASEWSARPDLHVRNQTIATDWLAAPAIATDCLETFCPDIVIHLGVSERARHLVLELCAYNDCHAKPDVNGGLPRTTDLDPDQPAATHTTAPVNQIATRLEAAGHDVTVSNDPGRYLCNAVYHETLSEIARTQSQTKAIFVHIPTNLNTETITQARAVSALGIILDTMLES